MLRAEVLVRVERLAERRLGLVEGEAVGGLHQRVRRREAFEQRLLLRLVAGRPVRERTARGHGEQHERERQRQAAEGGADAERGAQSAPGAVGGDGEQEDAVADEEAEGHAVDVGGERDHEEGGGGEPAERGADPVPQQDVAEAEAGEVEEADHGGLRRVRVAGGCAGGWAPYPGGGP